MCPPNHEPTEKLTNVGRELAGLSAVVTGSTRGIGKSVAVELSAAGAEVLVHGGHDEERAAMVVEELRGRGASAEQCIADLSRQAGQDLLLERAFQWREPLDIWVNVAGADVLTGAAANWSFERKLQALLDVDVGATLRLSRQVGSKMRKQGGGVILNVGWDQAARGMAGDSGELFAAAKGAIMAFTKSCAASLAPGVRVNAVAPGWIRTAWGERASEAWQRRAVAESQLGRWGTTEDVAKVARFLVSPAAAFITGQVVEVNGGFQPSS